MFHAVIIKIDIGVNVKSEPVKGTTVQIGELSRRTQTPTRLLRYYEEQGLLVPDRLPNGYRDYNDEDENRVRQVRGLLEAGVSTRVIGQIIPCLAPRGLLVPYACAETYAALVEQRDRLNNKINDLTRHRDAIDDYLHDVRSSELPVSP